MKEGMMLVAFFVVMICVCWLLYRRGILAYSSKRAILFSGSFNGRSGCRAKFTSCTGYVKRVILVKEPKAVVYRLESSINKGTLTVELSDERQKELAVLSGNNVEKKVFLEPGERYYLVFRFSRASGSMDLRWE